MSIISNINIFGSNRVAPEEAENNQKRTIDESTSFLSCITQPFKHLHSQWQQAKEDQNILRKFTSVTNEGESNQLINDVKQLSDKIEYVKALIDLKDKVNNKDVHKAIDTKILSIVNSTTKSGKNTKKLCSIRHKINNSKSNNTTIKEAVFQKQIQLIIYDPKWSNEWFLLRRSHIFLKPPEVPSGSSLGTFVKVKNFFQRQLDKINLIDEFQGNDKIINLLKDAAVFDDKRKTLSNLSYHKNSEDERKVANMNAKVASSQRFSKEIIQAFRENNVRKNIDDLNTLSAFLPEGNLKKAIQNLSQELQKELDSQDKVEKVIDTGKRYLEQFGQLLPGFTKTK